MWPLGDVQKACTCAPALITKYQNRISAPILDRIDIHIEVPRVDCKKLSGDRIGETSEWIRTRAQVARDKQLKRFLKNGSSDIVCNADMRVGRFASFAAAGGGSKPDAGGDIVLCMSQLNFSARAYHRLLKLARTIADLAGCEEIQAVHWAETLQYRPKLLAA